MSKYELQALYIDKELMRSRSYNIPGTAYTVRRCTGYNTVIDHNKNADVFNYTYTRELAQFLEKIER